MIGYSLFLLLVKGAIPGSKSGFVKVRLSAKKDKVNAGISKHYDFFVL
jgi:ribosomal protein L3